MKPVSVTRDLVHFRKLPARHTALAAVATSFLNLLSSTDHPSAPQLRSAFLPALTGSDQKPRDPGVAQDFDRQLLDFFLHPPAITLLQAVLSTDQIENAWKGGEDSPMTNSIFLSFPLHQELERAKSEGQKEEIANLSMMVIATVAHELAQWIYVKVNGYHYPDAYSDTASLHTTQTRVSVSSLKSNESTLVPSRNKDDVGFRAVMALMGCDYELLTYAIGERQLVKRRFPTRRSASLTPPLIYYLIGDTPAIVDITSWPPTVAGMTPPFKEGDSMYAIASVLTPSGIGKLHGSCLIASSDSVSLMTASTDDHTSGASGYNK
ncbi:uncharacterized protein JCM6883_004236 [Sporobolomyces salmoneus]|uniref:uncharacterized protein n=1 Tax=Sporobolomyces salmoneus TaxID=183962 RepID=UPI003182B4EA